MADGRITEYRNLRRKAIDELYNLANSEQSKDLLNMALLGDMADLRNPNAKQTVERLRQIINRIRARKCDDSEYLPWATAVALGGHRISRDDREFHNSGTWTEFDACISDSLQYEKLEPAALFLASIVRRRIGKGEDAKKALVDGLKKQRIWKEENRAAIGNRVPPRRWQNIVESDLLLMECIPVVIPVY